jgi:hypothetical protein
MNEYLKKFLHRGAIFGGFGPIIVGIVYMSIGLSGVDLALSGAEVPIAIISTYIIAFVQAGASVFNQIEGWSIARSLLFHFSSIYIVYAGAYIVNSWIPFEPMILIVFTAAFVLTYFAVWLTVFFVMRASTKKMNERIMSMQK